MRLARLRLRSSAAVDGSSARPEETLSSCGADLRRRSLTLSAPSAHTIAGRHRRRCGATLRRLPGTAPRLCPRRRRRRRRRRRGKWRGLLGRAARCKGSARLTRMPGPGVSAWPARHVRAREAGMRRACDSPAESHPSRGGLRHATRARGVGRRVRRRRGTRMPPTCAAKAAAHGRGHSRQKPVRARGPCLACAGKRVRLKRVLRRRRSRAAGWAAGWAVGWAVGWAGCLSDERPGHGAGPGAA